MTRTLVFVLPALWIGCAVEVPSGSGAVVRDSAGVVIVENDEPVWGDSDVWRVADTPRQRIGTVDGDSDRQLYQVRDAHRFDDGRIVVANGGTNELRFFAPDGRPLGASGRDGEGPGEYRFLTELHVLGDTLYIHDRGLNRLTVAASDGRFVRTVPLPALGDRFPSQPMGWFADGSFLARSFPPFWTDPEVGLQRLQDTYLVVDASGAITDTLGEYPGEETYIDLQDGEAVSMRLPFARMSVSVVGSASFFFGANETYKIEQYSRDGQLLRSVRLAREIRVPTAEDLGVFLRDLLPRVPEERRAGLERHYRAMPLSEMFPLYSSLSLDVGGYLWVQDYMALPIGPTNWSVFDPEGRFMGSVALPDRFTPYQIGNDFVLGRSQDDLDVEFVDVYELVKPE